MGIIQMIFLGIGLAMDAGAVAMGNGLAEPKMKIKKIILISLFFGAFQLLMPLIGYFAGSIFTELISQFTPWIALILLGFIGGKMIYEGIKDSDEEKEETNLSLSGLVIQAIATSIDALTVGLIFVGKGHSTAILASVIIGIVTFMISFGCVLIGKKFGDKLGSKAEIVGGIILIIIGLKTFIEYLIEIL